MVRNINLFPWFKFAQSLIFWQATWFLYFERNLSAAEAIFLYVIYDIATTVLEVPSGYMSDRLGRRLTLIAAALSGLAAVLILVFGEASPSSCWPMCCWARVQPLPRARTVHYSMRV